MKKPLLSESYKKTECVRKMPTSPRLVDHMMSKMEEERKSLQEENENLQQKLRELRAKIENNEHLQQDLRGKVDNYEKKERSCDEQMKLLKEENGRLLDLGEAMKKHLENEAGEKITLLKQIENLEGENKTLRVTVQEASNEIKRWQEETNRYKSIIHQYEDSIHDNGDLKNSFDEQVRAMKKMAKEYAQSKEILREEIEGLKKEKSGQLSY